MATYYGLASILALGCLLAIPKITNASLKFYDNVALIGSVVYETDTPENCQAIPDYAYGIIKSVSPDICTMVYESRDCKNGSKKIMPYTRYQEPYTDQYTPLEMAKVGSFRACNDDERNSTLRVSLYREPKLDTLLMEYKMINNCTYVPAHAKGNVQSLNNHGTCVRIYSSWNCTDNFFDLRAGETECSQNLSKCAWTERPDFPLTIMQSFEPCFYPERPKHVRIEAKVYQFGIQPQFSWTNIENVELAARTEIINNGSGTITVEYKKEKTFQNSVQLLKNENFPKINMMSEQVTNDAAFRLALLQHTGFQNYGVSSTSQQNFENLLFNAIADAYTYSNAEEKSAQEALSVQEIETFSVTEKIEIPPLTEYEISSFIKTFQDAKLDYYVLMEISGTYRGNESIHVIELRRELGSLNYIGTKGFYTVLVNATGSIKTSFGFDTVVNAHSYQINSQPVTESDE